MDANHDGKTDAGELHDLAEFGIVELDLEARAGTDMNNGNLIGLVSSFTKADGSQHVMADVWFAKDVAPAGAAAEPPAALGDLLAAPDADLLSGAGANGATSGARGGGMHTAGGPYVDRRQWVDEETRTLPLV